MAGEWIGVLNVGLEIPVEHQRFLLFQTPDTFVAGLVFSLLRESSGSTLFCILLHAFFNLAFFTLV